PESRVLFQHSNTRAIENGRLNRSPGSSLRTPPPFTQSSKSLPTIFKTRNRNPKAFYNIL
ncbi:MAG: hypothetical protein ACFFDN_44720, partial [Candidatus Hodarchaeota archaeon]